MIRKSRATKGGFRLCAAFAAVALSATAQHASTPRSASVADSHPSATEISVHTQATMTQFITGDEAINKPVLFSDIPAKGDARMKRIVDMLRLTGYGRDLYDFAVREKLSLEWETTDDRQAGIYHHLEGAIAIEARNPDDSALLTLVHEIEHAKQYRILKVAEQPFTPQQRWQVSRMVEADSCAASVIFHETFKNETGRTLDSSYNFSKPVIDTYMATPPAQRHPVSGALEPCFARIAISYDDMHMETVRIYQNNAKNLYNDAVKYSSEFRYKGALKSAFKTPDDDAMARLIGGFETVRRDPSFRPGTADMMTWLEKHTPVQSPAHRAELDTMQAEFIHMRDILTAGPRPTQP